jgi:hypothetical protein
MLGDIFLPRFAARPNQTRSRTQVSAKKNQSQPIHVKKDKFVSSKQSQKNTNQASGYKSDREFDRESSIYSHITVCVGTPARSVNSSRSVTPAPSIPPVVKKPSRRSARNKTKPTQTKTRALRSTKRAQENLPQQDNPPSKRPKTEEQVAHSKDPSPPVVKKSSRRLAIENLPKLPFILRSEAGRKQQVGATNTDTVQQEGKSRKLSTNSPTRSSVQKKPSSSTSHSTHLEEQPITNIVTRTKHLGRVKEVITVDYDKQAAECPEEDSESKVRNIDNILPEEVEDILENKGYMKQQENREVPLTPEQIFFGVDTILGKKYEGEILPGEDPHPLKRPHYMAARCHAIYELYQYCREQQTQISPESQYYLKMHRLLPLPPKNQDQDQILIPSKDQILNIIQKAKILKTGGYKFTIVPPKPVLKKAEIARTRSEHARS